MYRAVVVGCGRIGSLYDHDRPESNADPLTHAGAYAAHSRVQLAAGVDPVVERRNQFTAQWKAPAYASVAEMLKEVRPDLWSICTAPQSHLALVQLALANGARGIWCEKPLADTLVAAAGIVRACETMGVALMVNHSRRFDRFHQDLARRLQTGEWGRVERVLIHYTRGIANYGTHAFDLLRLLVGDEIACLSACDDLHEADADPSLTVRGITRRGLPFALLPTRRAHYDSLEVDVWASAGRVTITHLGRGVRQYRVGPSPDWDEPAVLLETPGEFLHGMHGMTCAAVSNLIAYIEAGEPLLSSGRDGLAALAAVCAAERSAARSGQPVDVGGLLTETWKGADA